MRKILNVTALDGDAGRACAVDQRAAMRHHRLGRLLGGRGGGGLSRLVPGELRWIRVEAETDLAAALLDERR